MKIGAPRLCLINNLEVRKSLDTGWDGTDFVELDGNGSQLRKQ